MRAFPAVLAAALLAPLVACEEPTPTELDLSRDTWRAEADQHDAYEYTRRALSWTGWSMTTRVTVRDDQVIGRAYENSDGVTWVETGAEVGSHDAGYPAVTVDALYDECEREILTQDPAENEITLRFDERGFLDACLFRPYDCEDDCVEGIAFESLEFLLEDCKRAGGDC